ncbi:hypothetical protein SprV_0602223200 [Sparganum proliferum]
MRITSLILFHAVLLSSVVSCVRSDEQPTYNICKERQKNCTTVSYRVEDQSKGLLCRQACGRKRGGLNTNWTAYHCDANCSAYDVYGRDNFEATFNRHVMCVQMCHFVAKVQHNSNCSLNLCSANKSDCMEIQRKGGTFNAFNICAFKCDGWPKLENTVMHTTLICCNGNNCKPGSYFTEPNEANPFGSLKTCFSSCLAGISCQCRSY